MVSEPPIGSSRSDPIVSNFLCMYIYKMVCNNILAIYTLFLLKKSYLYVQLQD